VLNAKNSTSGGGRLEAGEEAVCKGGGSTLVGGRGLGFWGEGKNNNKPFHMLLSCLIRKEGNTGGGKIRRVLIKNSSSSIIEEEEREIYDEATFFKKSY